MNGASIPVHSSRFALLQDIIDRNFTGDITEDLLSSNIKTMNFRDEWQYNVEAVGAGTLAFDNETGQISPHIHVSIGRKTDAATARMSHLLSAKVLFLTEMVVVEVIRLMFRRIPNPFSIMLASSLF